MLAAGFGEASRQQKLEALTVMETDLAEDFERREERIRAVVEGEEFLRRSRLLVLDADREPATVAERGRVIDQADRLWQEAKREAEAKRQAEQERETRQWEEQRAAAVQALKRLSGGMDLYHAHLADLDPKWDLKRNDKSSRENIDAALVAARSDAARLERLRVVLSNEVDTARYREELGKVAGQFKTSDLDRALAVAGQEREERETRQWEEQRAVAVQALKRLSGGMDLYHAHLADLDPKWDLKRNDKSSRENIDAALVAARSDAARLERLRVVLSNEVDTARYREELGKVAGQFKTSDLDRALAVAEQDREERETRQWEEQKAARVRREALHQMVSDTPGGDECLRAAGWEKARTDGMQDRVLATVELSLTADINRREQQLRTDDEGEAFLRRGRVEVLEADRAPETLAERGRVIDRAEALRQAALVERKRQAAGRRVGRLKQLFAVPGGDKAFVAALDVRKPTWRETGTRPADIDFALDRAEGSVDRTKATTAEHEVIVDAEQTFQGVSSEDWRQAGDRFPKGSPHAHMSQQLADRTRASALAAEREEPPSSPALVQRLLTWLRAQVDKLLQRLGVVKPATRRRATASGADQPSPPVSSPPTTPGAGTPSRSGGRPPVAVAVSGRETERQAVDEQHRQKAGHGVEHSLPRQELERQLAKALPTTRDVYEGGKTHYGTIVEAVSDPAFDAVDRALDRGDAIDDLVRERMRSVRRNLHHSPEMRSAAEWQHVKFDDDVRSAESAERVRIAKERSRPASWLRREKFVEPHLVELSDDQKASARQTARKNLVERIVRKSRDLCRSILDRDHSAPALSPNAGARVGVQRPPAAGVGRVQQQRDSGRTKPSRGR